jgi:ribonucleotide monophosphatase NagD (HAD superfamily)
MVGDDLQTDVAGSRALGIRAFMVRTGKYRAEEVERAETGPDRIIDSVSALPDLLLG